MIKKIFLFILILVVTISCSNIKETLSLKRKKNVDEFLIEKKEPLTKPPNFNELPEPMENKINKTLDEDIDFSEIINTSEKKNNKADQLEIEKSILDILNKK